MRLVVGDIAEQATDAVVTAAHWRRNKGMGTDGTIHSKGGPKIYEECQRIGGCPIGDAVITRLRGSWSPRSVLALIATWALTEFLGLAGSIEPQLNLCTLQIGDQVLKPTEVANPWRMAYRVGTNRFFLAGGTIQQQSAVGKTGGWTARLDGALHLHWVANDRSTAYLVAYQADQTGRFQGYESPPKLRRLDLDSGKWLPELPVAENAPTGFAPKNVVGVLTGNGGVVVLTRFTKGESKGFDEATSAAYVLRQFKEDANKPSWSKQYMSSGKRPYTGGYVWGIPPPLYAGSAIQCLSWLGDRLLVCPEAMEPIRCLNPDTGTEIWQVDRLWEFQRGFIGPSVWSHYISRFGTGDFDRRKPLHEERKAFDQQYRCALVGGPVAMPLDFDRGNDAHSVFVTAVKGPAGAWSGYLSECLLYELGDDGKVISVVTLPRIVDGSRSFSRRDGVVWKCQKETFVKASPAQRTPEAVMGGGGADGVANLAWTRRVQYREPPAWFLSGKAGDPFAFGESHAFCLPGGGYVSRESEKLYSFPIAAVDLSTGVDSLFVLRVPFNGTFSIPTSNIGSETASDGTKTYRTSLFHLLAITQLAAEGQEIEIAIATENQRYGLKFDLATVLKAKLAALTDPVTDTKQAARARAKLVDPKQFDEALQDAAHGTDIEFLKAILEAGGNPKHASDVGWTALMVAATYGTAAMVDLLIAAGSNVNAADKNCGGQTTLMWAARSGREAKRKIRSLLKAGADPNGTSVGGYNALMSAASSGDVEAVESLLHAGLSVSARDHDKETVLMAGARSGKANIITVLIAAGGDVNAKANDGTTALMRAAQGYDSAGAVEALLKAGADPNARDQNGHTALQIAGKSNHSGANEVVGLLKPVTTAK